MGKTCLLDTNIVIYYLDARMPVRQMDFVESCLNESGSTLSVITKIELLGWKAPSPAGMRILEQFVADSVILPLSDEIVDAAISLRRTAAIKLPDAVIAATALVYDYTLISRNDADFRSISGLSYLNPFQIPE